MKRITGIFVGLIMTAAFVFFYNLYLDKQIMENKEAVRNHRTYERYWSRDTADLIMDENTLIIFGSSEMRSLENYEEHVGSFLNAEDMNIMPVGAGYFQSLSHAVMLGAVAESMRNNTVALFLSPQWFEANGVSPDAFAPRFSEDELLGFLANDRISGEKKDYVLKRVEELLVRSPIQQRRVRRYAAAYRNRLRHPIQTVYTGIMSGFWKIKAKNSVVKQIKNMAKELPVYNLEDMDWNAVYRLAQKQGEEACTNNDFGIYNEYWDLYVKETYEKGEIEEKTQTYLDSPEYDDLKCFLGIAEELNIRVLLVSIPVNERWYYYQGMLCDEYYAKVRAVSGEFSNVELVDMTEYGDEKYFLADVMHLGWKGWARINEELYTRFKEK